MNPSASVFVCLKQVASTLRFTADHLLDRAAAVQGFNPDDGAALEAALLLRDKIHATVTVLTMGPPSAEKILRDALARGADNAVLIADDCLRGSDSLCTARVLAKALRFLNAEASFSNGISTKGLSSDSEHPLKAELSPQEKKIPKASENTVLVLCGRHSADGDTGQVPPMLAGFLDTEFVPDLTADAVFPRIFGTSDSMISDSDSLDFHVSDSRVSGSHAADFQASDSRASAGFSEAVGISGVVTVAKAAYLRQPRMMGLRRAAKAVIRTLTAADLQLSAADCGLSASPTRILRTELVERPVKTPRRMTPQEILSFMRNPSAAAVSDTANAAETVGDVQNSVDSDNFGSCLVLDKPVPAVYTQGYQVELFPLPTVSENPRFSVAAAAKALAARIGENPPALILASSESTSMARYVLPYAAALCNLGMTADCIALRHENGELVQVRPAFGGDILAQITTRTHPPAATVRAAVQSRVMLSGGRGLGSAENFRRLERIARALSVEIGASRGAVDAGFAPYAYQIGQSGKGADVSLYIAVGISGASQHLAGLRNAQSILSVNPDRLAPIRLVSDGVAESDAETVLTIWEQELKIQPIQQKQECSL